MAVLRELWPDTEVFLGWVSSMFWSHWNRGLPALQFLKKKKRKRKDKKRKKKKREKSWRTCARTLCTREQRTAMMPLQNLERRHQRSFWNILKKTGPTVEKCGWNFPERRCSIIMGNRTTNRVESFHAKIKAFVKPSSSVPACVWTFQIWRWKTLWSKSQSRAQCCEKQIRSWCGLSAQATSPADCNHMLPS